MDFSMALKSILNLQFGRMMINKVIKGEWDFDGFIYSDGGGLDLVHQSFGELIVIIVLNK